MSAPDYKPTHRFTYAPAPDNEHDYITATIESRSVELDDVLVAMEAYLVAAGFVLGDRKPELIEAEGE